MSWNFQNRYQNMEKFRDQVLRKKATFGSVKLFLFNMKQP